jgi:bifunctional DNA-binding transcriptional regulator/antitoxin component of YhaV-PrlF toxin-antitoxin module
MGATVRKHRAHVDRSRVQAIPLRIVDQVKHRRRRGYTRISRKHQATLPVAALRQAGLKAGDELMVEAAGVGRIVLVRADDLIERHAGKAPGVYPPDYLREMREEWP